MMLAVVIADVSQRDWVPDREICIIDGLLCILRIMQEMERNFFRVGPMRFAEFVDHLFAAHMEQGADFSVLQSCHLLSVPNHILAKEKDMSQNTSIPLEIMIALPFQKLHILVDY